MAADNRKNGKFMIKIGRARKKVRTNYYVEGTGMMNKTDWLKEKVKLEVKIIL